MDWRVSILFARRRGAAESKGGDESFRVSASANAALDDQLRQGGAMVERANQAGFLLSAAPRLRANKINAWAFRDGGVWRNVDVFTRRRKGAKRVCRWRRWSLSYVIFSAAAGAGGGALGADIFAPSRLRVNTSIDASPWRLATIVRADLARRCR